MSGYINKYRIYCQTDGKWEYTWNTVTPTTCPTNSFHTINVNSIAVSNYMKDPINVDVATFTLRKSNFYRCNTLSSSITFNLTPAADNKDRIVFFQKITNMNTLIIDAYSTELINGQLSYSMTVDKEVIKLYCDGTTWSFLSLADADGEISIIDNDADDYGKGQLIVSDETEKISISGVNNTFLKADNTQTTGFLFTYVTKADVGLGDLINIKSIYNAIGPPTVNDDTTQGYSIGSRWIDLTNNKEYVATNVTTNAAIWIETSNNNYVNDLKIYDASQDNTYDIGVSELTANRIVTLPALIANDTFVFENHQQTLTNKNLTDNSVTYANSADNTKRMQFNLSGITTNTTRTIIIPNANTTMVGTDTTQILTNKTLTAPVISTIVNTGTLTLPTSTDTLVARNTTDILTNKSLQDATTYIIDDIDATKRLQFECSSITTATTRILTVPNASTTIVGTDVTQTLTNKTLITPIIAQISNTGTLTLPTSTDTLIGRATTDTLTNKTLTAPIIATIVNTGTLTLPTSTDTLVGRATTDTLTNKSLVDTSTYVIDDGDATKRLRFECSGITTATTRTLTIPNNSGTIALLSDIADQVTLTGTQTLTNKSLVDVSTYIIDDADTTKRMQFECSGITTATTRILTIPNASTTIVGTDVIQTLTNKTLTAPVIATIVNTGTLTLPTSTDTLVGRATTDTLTNKTLTAPIIATIVNTGTLTLPTSTDTLVARNTTDILTNKSLQDATTYIIDNVDATKRLQFECSGITTATTRTLTIPNANTTIVGTDVTQTLTNKTLTAPVIATIVNTGTLTLPTTSDTLVGRVTTDTLTNKSLQDATTYIIDNGDITKRLQFECSGITTATTRTLTVPNASTTIVGTDVTQTLTNKSLQDASTFIIDDTDATKRVQFECSGITTATTRTLTVPNNSGTIALLSDIANQVTLAGTQTLTNKSLVDSSTFIIDDTDATKRLQFECSSITTATTRILTIPNASTTIVGTDVTQTLTNKTLTAPVIATIVNTGTLTLPTSTDTLIGRNTMDTLTNKSLQDATTFVIDDVDTTKRLRFECSNITTATTRILTIPDNSGIIALLSDIANQVTLAGTQTLTNKSLVDASTYIIDDIDATKRFQFECSGITTATTRTLTIPDANTTIVGTNTTQTLTNKTLTAPVIATIVNTGTLTLPTSTDTLVGRATIDILTNKSLQDISTFVINDGDITKRLRFECSGITTATTRVLTIPDNSGTIALLSDIANQVTLAGTQTLTNKSLVDASTYIIDDTDATKRLQFECSGITTATTRTLTIPNNSGTIALLSDIANQVTLTGTQTLTNKSLVDASTYIIDDVDATKRVQFECSGITTATTRTLTIPDASTTIVGTNVTQTLTNKTLTAPVIATIVNTGTLTLPTSTDTLVGRNTTDTLTNKTLTLPIIAQISNIGSLTLPTTTDTLVGRNTTDILTNKSLQDSTLYIIDNGDVTKRVQFECAGITTATTRTLTIPNNSGTIALLSDIANQVTLTGIQTLTNKSLVDALTYIIDDVDATKRVQFECSGITTSTTRILTIPDSSTVIVGTDVTQTLTNKTLTLPKIYNIASSFTYDITPSAIIANRTITLPLLTTNDTFVFQSHTQTLTNKTLTLPIIAQISNTGTLTLPTTTDTLIGRTTTDTLTNKTLTLPIISQISNTGTLTLPITTDTLIGRTTTDTLTNKSFSDSTTYVIDDGDATKRVQFECSGITTATTRTLTIPNNSGTIALLSDIANQVTLTGTQTLTNKSFVDTSTYIIDDVDATKRVQFECSGITTATTRILTIPNASTTIVGTDVTQTLTNKTLTLPKINNIASTFSYDITPSAIIANRTITLPLLTTNDTFVFQSHTQTLTNKTLTAPIISSILNTGTLTLPTTTDTLVGRNTTDTLTNKSLQDSTLFIIDNGDVTKRLQFECSGISTATTRTLTIPNNSGTIALLSDLTSYVTLTGTQTLTNKSLVDVSTFIIDDGDATKRVQFECSSITTATTRILTIPNASTTIVGTDVIQTLTNKTLTAPVIDTIVNTGTLTLPTTTDTLVGRSTTDTLTNKIITDTSNNVAAKSLLSATTNIDVFSADAPTAGQVLTATSATSATWQNMNSGSSLIAYDAIDTSTSTTSNSFATINGMSETLTGGIYYVIFSASGRLSSSSASAEISVYVDNTLSSGTARFYGPGSTLGGIAPAGLQTQAVVTINNGSNINIRYRTSNGTFTIYSRNMVIFKVG